MWGILEKVGWALSGVMGRHTAGACREGGLVWPAPGLQLLPALL